MLYSTSIILNCITPYYITTLRHLYQSWGSKLYKHNTFLSNLICCAEFNFIDVKGHTTICGTTDTSVFTVYPIKRQFIHVTGRMFAHSLPFICIPDPHLVIALREHISAGIILCKRPANERRRLSYKWFRRCFPWSAVTLFQPTDTISSDIEADKRLILNMGRACKFGYFGFRNKKQIMAQWNVKYRWKKTPEFFKNSLGWHIRKLYCYDMI